MRAWRRPRGRVVAIVAVAAGVGIGGFAFATRAGAVPDVPTVAVTQGEFVDYLQVRGAIRPAKSIVLAAPMQAGELQIMTLAKNGSAVKPGDVLVEFDGTSLRQRMQEKQSELKQADAEIAQVQAQQRITLQQDETAVMRAKYSSIARSWISGNAISVSKLEYEQAKLAVADAEQKLVEAQQKAKSDKVGADADVQAKLRKREKAEYDVERARVGLEALRDQGADRRRREHHAELPERQHVRERGRVSRGRSRVGGRAGRGAARSVDHSPRGAARRSRSRADESRPGGNGQDRSGPREGLRRHRRFDFRAGEGGFQPGLAAAQELRSRSRRSRSPIRGSVPACRPPRASASSACRAC